MEIIKILNQIARENTYLLVNEKAILLIDPGSNGREILAKLDELEKPVAAILLTHTHYDHIMSLDLVRQHCGHPPVYVSDKEASWLYTPVDNLSGLPRHDDLVDVIMEPAEQTFQYNEIYDIADFQFEVRQTPGHSCGGVSFVFAEEECVITGDALFKEAIGRTDLPTGNFDTLISSIRQELFTLPGHFIVYPGHGMATSIGHEKTFNPFF